MPQSGDPKRPKKVFNYKPPKVNLDEVAPDYMTLISLVLGMAGLLLRNKLAAWLALFSCVASLANVKTSEMDLKQIICSVTFSIMGLVMNYVSNNKGALAASSAAASAAS